LELRTKLSLISQKAKGLETPLPNYVRADFLLMNIREINNDDEVFKEALVVLEAHVVARAAVLPEMIVSLLIEYDLRKREMVSCRHFQEVLSV
jgi:hypothetical protein